MQGTQSRTGFELPTGESLGLITSPVIRPAAFPGAELQRLEYSCRGDRVPCTLLSPAASAPGDSRRPLVLLQPEARDRTSPPLPERTRDWIEAGCAVATIDLPLQGVRRSAKQSELLAGSMQAAARGAPLEHAEGLLWCEFTRQAVLELRRTLDVLTELPHVDPERIGFAGFGIGGFTGAILCAVDSRPCAAVLAATGGGFAPPEIDPARYVGAIAPRPLLLVNEKQASPGASGIGVSTSAAKRLHDAANEPKRVEWRADAAQAHDAAWLFLSPLLGL
jgi:dienelactone hydrolase